MTYHHPHHKETCEGLRDHRQQMVLAGRRSTGQRHANGTKTCQPNVRQWPGNDKCRRDSLDLGQKSHIDTRSLGQLDIVLSKPSRHCSWCHSGKARASAAHGFSRDSHTRMSKNYNARRSFHSIISEGIEDIDLEVVSLDN